MKRTAFTILLGLTVLAFSACAAAIDSPTQEPAPATATTAAPPSPTIVWFPPSATPTTQSLPTAGPTPERKPGVGRVLLVDNFTSASRWNAAMSEEASVDVSHDRLTIAVQPGVSAFRIRQGPVLTDFYAEITARPSLCRDKDEYGLLFRAPNNVAYYSFTLACDGTARVDRVRLGHPNPLHAASASADVPPGAPGEVRLGVWVSGADMRFFLNGRYQFGIMDHSYKSGALGAFVRSSGDTPATVTFSELSIYSVTYSPPSATPTP